MSAKVRDLVHRLIEPPPSLVTKCGAVITSRLHGSRNPVWVTCSRCGNSMNVKAEGAAA